MFEVHELHPFVLACLVGDGCLYRTYTMAGGKKYQYVGLKISHGTSQLPYLQWKADRLNAIFGRSVKVCSDASRKTERSTGFQGYTYRFMGHCLEPYYALLYPNGRKTISAELLLRLGLPELAVIWMDDGSGGTYNETYRWKRKDGSLHERVHQVGRMELGLCHCDDHEVELVRLWFKGLTGVHLGLKGQGTKQRFTVPLARAFDLCELLRPYFEPSMLYKLDLIPKVYQRARAVG